jgi:hypothetical protein
MPSFVMLCRVALVITDVSEEHIPSIIRVTRISELGTMLSVTNSNYDSISSLRALVASYS